MKLFNLRLLVFSFLGVNMGLGLRSDHVTVYFYLIAFLVLSLLFERNIEKRYLIVSGLFLLASLFCAVGDVLMNPVTRVSPFIQAFENVFNPFALFFVVAVALKNVSESHLKQTVFFFVLMMGFLSVFSFFNPNHGAFNFLTSGFADEESVRNQSLAVGRSLGGFNQPLEAGLFFGSAHLMLLYFMLKRKSTYEGVQIAMVMFINFIGGMLSLSKTFYVLALGLSLVYLLIIGRRALVFNSIALSCLLLVSFVIFAEGNNYTDSLADLYFEFGLLAALTAGRFGNTEGTTVVQLFEVTTENSPLFGNGLGTYLPLDNGYLEYYFQGGVLAITPIIGVLLYMLWLSHTNWKTPNGKMLFVFVLFVILANLGGPVFTANKANIMIAISFVFFSKPYNHA